MVIIISIIFFLFPIFSFPLIILAFLLDKNYKHKIIYAVLLALLAAILLYYFIPDSSKDLYRYYTIMGRLSNLSLNDFFIYMSGRTEPLANIYFYIFAKTGNNNLIMIVTTLISYGLIYYVIFNHQKVAKLSNLDFNVIFLFILSVLYLVDDITGIRFCIARLLVFLALYLDLFKGKKNTWIILLYLISMLIHTSCIVFVLARLFMKISKNKFNICTFLFLLLIAMSPQLIITASSYLSNVPFLSSLSAKAQEYLNLNAGLYSMFVLQIIIAIVLYIILLYAKTKKHCYSFLFT